MHTNCNKTGNPRTYKRNTEGRSGNHFCSGKPLSITYSGARGGVVP